MGKNVYFGRSVEIIDWKNLIIGSNVSIHKGCYLIADGGLQIGDNVSVAHYCSLLTTQHSYLDDTNSIRSNEIIMLPLTICDDVWIGCGSRIMGGVIIHERSIVGAGSVVTRDVPDNCVVAGVPAKKIKDIR
ncbi:MAG: acyltransferase [Candidatus Cloacimonetes bacterium]|nr:acyltransferase [Bacteroidota bacterium]MBL7086580.1 acyltransferase [Candidatus Cloacimonadota bacterium]